MTADREGVTVSPNTVKWLNIIAIVCALGGPPVTLAIGVYVFTKTQVLIDEAQDERAAALKLQVERENADLRSGIAHTDIKFDKINDDLSDIKQAVNQIIGKLNK